MGKTPQIEQLPWSATLASLLIIVGAAVPSVCTPGDTQAGGDPHAAHRAMLEAPKRYQRTQRPYDLPNVSLVTMSGSDVALATALGGDKPVILTFIFTSCATICPILTATLAQADTQLREIEPAPRIVAISIDPEYDTPARLRDYAKSYGVGPDWSFLTGQPRAVTAVQQAFDVYRGDKANHIPVTLVRTPGSGTWVRFDGFTTAADLVREYNRIVAP